MSGFAPFAVRADLALPTSWASWVGAVISGHASLPPDAGFAQVAPQLARHGVLPLLYDRLREQATWANLPPAMRAELASSFQENAARSFLLETELGRMASACAGAGLLKGMALGQAVYGNPALRPVSDVDLLVAPERVGQVAAQLADLGYRGAGLAAHPRLGRLARRYRSELPLLATVPGLGQLLVELHWSLAELPHYVDMISAAALLQGAKESPLLPAYYVPRPAVLLAYAAGHLALHHSRDLRLIWLVDLDRLARSPTVDWADLLDLVERWKLGLALHAGLQVASRWLGTPVDAGVMAALGRLARDRVAVRAWGLGDAAPGRAWRRAGAALAGLPPPAALRYAGWLLMRVLLRPLEHASRGETVQAPPRPPRMQP